MAYAKILIFEHRIPTYEETPESYNPPLFYFLSGSMAQVFSQWFDYDFIESLKSWQLLMAVLTPLAGWFWFDIFRKLNPKNIYIAWFYLIWLLSIPVLNKMIPMYNLEIPQLILASFLIWFFIKYILFKPTLRKIILLAIFCGIILSLRLMSFTLLLSMGLTLILAAYFKIIPFKKMLIYNLVFTIVSLLIGGQYYYFYQDRGVFGEKMEDLIQIPLWKRQPKSFYLDTFFRTMMRQPIRPNFPNRFIPIFYSDFWGDYWNYFPQRRFGLTIDELRKNRLRITQDRINRLAWQNRINLIPTIIIILGIIKAIISFIKSKVTRNKLTYRKISETFLSIFFVTTFLAFFYMNHKFANTYKGDTIKASYILYSIPCLVYFAVIFLQSLKKYRLLYFSLIILISISIAFNLEFNFF
ncbi:hypothetical protein KKE48_03955 [Patescibacteria group bacterium]|nr:hypothetical protein [Patescibacteria group bacterium]MBU1499992.1 hypothetical protein [Patescibacteria group bacterium]